jgi:glycosyltransferase involved in cell wall biosynthesis
MLAHGDEIDLVTMGFGDLPRIERLGNLTIHRLSCGRRSVSISHPHEMFVYILRAWPLITRLIRDRKYDLVHTHFILPDGFLAMLAARRTGVKYIVTAHGSDVPGYNPDRFKLLHHLLMPIWRQIVRQAECIVCPSNYILGLLRKSAPEAEAMVIPNGIDIGRFRPSNLRRKRIVVVSRLVERKGVQYLIRALKDLEHDYEVWVVGAGPYLAKLQRLSADLGVPVKFTGFVANTSTEFRDILEGGQIFVFTSSAENFPVVLLEAMAAGLCIITTDDTGCAEVVGDAALKVPPHDAGAIRQALLELMSDPARREGLARAARERVVASFTEAQVAEEYREIYKRFGRNEFA